MKRVLNLLAVMLLVVSGPALAAIGGGDGEIGFNYGNTQLDSSWDVDSHSATTLAVRGGYFFNPNIELEGQLSHSSDNTQTAGTNIDGTFRMYMVNGVYNFQAPKEIVPYVLAGMGVMDNEFKVLGVTTTDSSTAYQVGAGSRFFFGKAKKAAFRVDLSMVQESTFDQTNTHKNISAGFSWKLGN